MNDSTEFDLEKYSQTLLENTKKLETVINGFDKDRIVAKPADKWSILEIIEHIYLTDRAIYNLLKSPSEKISSKSVNFGSEKLQKILTNRHHKVRASKPLRPNGQFQTAEDAINAIKEFRQRFAEELQSGKIVFDGRIHSHFLIGEFTQIDWLYMLVYHTDRHILQMQETQ